MIRGVHRKNKKIGLILKNKNHTYHYCENLDIQANIKEYSTFEFFYYCFSWTIHTGLHAAKLFI